MAFDKDSDDVQGKVEELLKEAKRLGDHAKVSVKKIDQERGTIIDAAQTIRGVADSVKQAQETLHNSKETILGIHERFLRPILFIVGPPCRFIWHWYQKFWQRYAYKTEAATGKRVLSRSRSSLCIALTIAVISIFTPTRLGDAVRFVTVEPVLDSFLIGFSLKHETFYLNSSQEIDQENNIHAVRGCRHQGQCNEKDAVYFRVRPRLSHDIWKLIEYGNPIYVPDHVVAPIAPGVNRCEVTYYGYRMTSSWISRLIRSLQVYPTMLEASCTFIGSQS